MRAIDYKRQDPFLLCEIFEGRKVHLYIPLSFKMVSVCGRLVAEEGYSDDGTRQMCKTCTYKAAKMRERATKRIQGAEHARY